MSHVNNRLQEQLESVAQESSQFVREHAMSSAALAFGLGLGAGIAVIALCANSRSKNSTIAERVGQRMMDAMASITPDGFSNR